MRPDGYRPPDLIPPRLRARVLWIVETIAVVWLGIGIAIAIASILFR